MYLRESLEWPMSQPRMKVMMWCQEVFASLCFSVIFLWNHPIVIHNHFAIDTMKLILVLYSEIIQ